MVWNILNLWSKRRKLLLKNLIQEVGRADLAGHPRLYGVTNDFLDYFGLSTTDDLQSLEDIIPKEEEQVDDNVDLYTSKYQEE